MSNFQCPHCGMTNIDCGNQGYKTPKEIELEKENEELKKVLDEIEGITTVGYEGFCPKCSKKDCEDNNCYEAAIIDILQIIEGKE